MNTETDRRSSTRLQLRAVEGFLWVGLLLASLVALLFVKCGSPVAVGLLEPQGRLWWRWLLAFYLPIALGVGILVTVVTTALRSPRLSRVVLQAISAGVLLTLLVMNWACTIALLTGAEGSGPSWMVGGAAILALLALGALAIGLSWTRPNTVRGVSLLAVAACFTALPGAYSEVTDLKTVIATQRQTMAYLCIQEKEIENVYTSLEL